LFGLANVVIGSRTVATWQNHESNRLKR